MRAAAPDAAAAALSDEDRQGLTGPAIGAQLRRRRLAAVTAVKENAAP